MRLKLILWMMLFILAWAEEDNSSGPRSLLYRIFYPILPWRFTTPSPPTTTQTPEDLEAILQAIDTPAFKINNGSLSLNDTELVVVEDGSSSFRIIDDENVIQANDTIKSRPKLSTDAVTSSTTPSSAPKSSSRQPHRRFPVQTTTPKCEKLTEKQKYAKLESIGGRNQQFMANTPEEAARNFPHLVQTGDQVMDKASRLMSDAVGSGTPIDGNECDESCEEIRSKLHDALEEKQKSKSRNFLRLSDSGPAEVQEGKPENWKGGCYLEKFVPLGNCSSRGEEEIWGHEKLCTACQGIYILSDDCFPTFFNSITCDKNESECIFDQYTAMAHGKCQAKTLSFKVMRNKGSKECEEWVFEYIDVPIACECYLNKSSFLRSNPEL